MTMNRFTVEETNLLSIYADSSKPALLENIRAALPYMDADLRELAQRTMQKVGALTEAEYTELAVYAADEV
ncbi:conjugal transfer protein [Lachnospiraceae bacterium AM48-27BH]|nr:conjugal transfer protein [Lachnospiraceae bacterium AM48-27BH]